MYKIIYYFKYLTVLLIIILSVGLPKISQADTFVPGEALVKIQSGFDIDSILYEFHGSIIDSIIANSSFLISFPDSLDINFVLNLIAQHPEVLVVQPNYILGLPEENQISQSFPDQSSPGYLRGLEPPSYYQQPGAYQTGLDSAALIATGDSVIVAVIDNGIDYSHPLFGASISDTGYDFIDDDNYPAEDSGSMYGHGTFVSGLILLSAPDCKIMPLRAFDGDGQGNSFTITQSIYWAIDHHANIINMSFGMYTDNQLLQLAVTDAYQAGITMVASVGNDSTSQELYPAAYPEVIAVAAVDTLEYNASFSNYGGYIDICAPGVNLYSALAGQYNWGTWSGTSFSAPLVTGTCALLLGYKPDLTPSQMKENVKLTARTTLDWGTVIPPDDHYGYGCLDAFKALLAWDRGDVNNDGEINVTDLMYLINYTFSGGSPPQVSMAVADFNCDGRVNVSDLMGLINYAFESGPMNTPCY